MNTIEEGIHSDMSEEVYRKAPGVNVTALKKMKFSAGHYHYTREATESDKENAGFIIGTLTHRAKLEPDRFCYVVRPETYPASKTSKLVKDGKASVGDPIPWNSNATWCDEWLSRQTLPVVTSEQEQDILRCADALTGFVIDPDSGVTLDDLCAQGKTEVSAFKRHRTGLLLKGRADLVAIDIGGITWIVDLKTVPEEGASPEAFSRKIADLDYHQQAAHYCDLFDTDKFIFVAVEKKGFPGVAAYQLSARALEIGRRTNDALLTQLSRSIESGEWKGYPSGVREIDLPQWKIKQDGKDLYE